ncbi:ABC transporter ATP-binding protein [Micromonospora psammae]|uniref:ABC transporter ATP-binding protein n=1 Tax=Micromonospora sp. CPCC 205556 TaxID=3122398 RepID=UPI002FF3FF7D
MTTLSVHAASKRDGPVQALRGAELTVAAGTLTAVLSPSGCGKATLLRCIVGFERLDAGEIHVGDVRVAAPGLHVAPHRRRVAVVAQDGALFPHLDVAGNVGYGLDRAARRSGRIEEVLALVGLAGYGKRMPHQLSGGQQKRVAVARALAPRPPLILLDEPFTALDASLRADLRTDIRTALHADNATAVLVTHDQAEALSIADQVAVMHGGKVRQTGSPYDLYHAPADRWVAAFVGDANLLRATANGRTAHAPLGALPLAASHQGDVTVLVRPEQVRLHAASAPGVPATVRNHLFHGHDAVVDLQLQDDTRITARILDQPAAYAAGTSVRLTVHGTVHVLPESARS